jgi:antitoxin component YwqK of YwqJK toxin-antitoxin module
MFQILNKNIIEYVLNLYLDYFADILKLKRLYNFKFDIEKHLFINNKHKNTKYIYIDNKSWKDQNFNNQNQIQGETIFIYNHIKNKFSYNHFVYKEWYKNGVLRIQCRIKDGKKYGIMKTWHENVA